MLRLLPVLTATVLVLATGFVHGFWTERWTRSAPAADAATRLATLPLNLGERGEWQGEEIEVDMSQSGPISGFIKRPYVNRLTGDTVVLVLTCGRPGPVSIHTPEVCYDASGFNVSTRTKVCLPRGDAREEFWTADAIRTKATEETKVRLYWAWNAGSGWLAADDPRPAFARYPVLHKLYVLRALGSLGEKRKDEPCEAFLAVLLPEMQRTLFEGER